MTDPAEQPDAELLMPFIVAASNGGPFDDDAYVAGYEAGQWWERMRMFAAGGLSGATAVMPVRTANVPQLDLIAMQWAIHIETELVEEMPEWSWMTLHLPDAEEPA